MPSPPNSGNHGASAADTGPVAGATHLPELEEDFDFVTDQQLVIRELQEAIALQARCVAGGPPPRP